MKPVRLSPPIPSAAAAAVLALGLLAAGCAATPSGEPAALSPQVEAARTPTEHEALAQQYERRAAQARTEADQHRALAASYKRGTQYRWVDRVGPRSGMPAMPRHCEQLVRNDEDTARIYSEMAQQHREWARQAPAGASQ